MNTPLTSLKTILLALILTFLGQCAYSATNEPATSAPAAPVAKSAYPLTICVVSGDKLGQMGPPPTIDYKGTEVQFCCKDCVKDFNKDPEKYIKRLNDAVAKQAANSPALK